MRGVRSKSRGPAPAIDQQQLDRLAELGSHLRQVREGRVLSLETVAAQTLIQMRHLSAIEQGRLDLLPEPVYVQGFIRRFGDALGLDGAQLAYSFPVDSQQQDRPGWRESQAAQLRPMHLYLFYVALIACAVGSLSLLLERPEASVSDAETYLGGAAELTPTVTSPLPRPSTAGSAWASPPAASGNSGTATPFAFSGERPVNVGITLTNQSWLRVISDGKMEFEGMLHEGAQRTWSAKQKLVLRVGNAGGVMVTFNHQSPRPMGKPGEVTEATFVPRSIAPEAAGTPKPQATQL